MVGEILVKYHPTANNVIVGIIEEGAEAVVPDLIVISYILLIMHDSDLQISCREETKYDHGNLAGDICKEHVKYLEESWKK